MVGMNQNPYEAPHYYALPQSRRPVIGASAVMGILFVGLAALHFGSGCLYQDTKVVGLGCIDLMLAGWLIFGCPNLTSNV